MIIIIQKKKKKSARDYVYFYVSGSSKSVLVVRLNSTKLMKKDSITVIAETLKYNFHQL